jgi:organic radical activating enzyme
METAGNLWDPSIDKSVTRNELTLVCSPKTKHVHPMIAHYCRHWKYVVRAGGVDENGLPNEPTQANGGGAPWQLVSREATDTIWISPMDEHEPFKNANNIKAAVDICMKHGYRLSLQVHKILGMP